MNINWEEIMSIIFKNSLPKITGDIKLEVATPTYSGLKSINLNDSINPYTNTGPGAGGVGLTETEIDLIQDSSGGSADPNFSNVILLLPFDGGDGSTSFTTFGSHIGSITNNGSTVQKIDEIKFGTSSVFFNGIDNHLIAATTDSFGTSIDQDFTVEFWWKDNGSTNFNRVFQTTNSDTQASLSLSTIGSNLALWSTTANGVWNVTSGVSMGALSNIEFIHYAVSRSSNILYLFRNGILQFQTNVTGALYQNPGNIVGWGGQSGGRYAKGWLDDFRITTGVARYDGTNFTPPTEAFPLS